MRVEYDPSRDLLYLWLGPSKAKAARTEQLSPGVHVDFDRDGRLIGIEVLEASDVIEQHLQFDVALEQSGTKQPAAK